MKVLNFGSLNIDYVYKVDHIVARGETLLSSSRNIFAGGKGLNQSVALAKAGLPTYHAGNIGLGGEFLLDILKDAKVNVDNVRILEGTPSGHTVIQNDREGDNCILLFGGANQCVTKEQIDDTISRFEAGDYLVLQNEINELAYVIERAHAQGMKIVLNPSPFNENIKSVPLAYVDYFFVNEIEAGQILGTSATDEKTLLEGLHSKFPDAHIVLTLGAAGSCYMCGDKVVHQNIFKVEAVDTTAAGDTFSGYFLAGIIAGNTPEEALELAAKASSITVTRPGAAPSIPTLSEVRESVEGEAGSRCNAGKEND